MTFLSMSLLLLIVLNPEASFNRKKAGTIVPAVLFKFFSIGGFQNTVVAVFSLVDNVDCFRVHVKVDIEIVL